MRHGKLRLPLVTKLPLGNETWEAPASLPATAAAKREALGECAPKREALGARARE